MCGIASVLAVPGATFNNRRYREVCRKMLAAIRHRGPDSHRIQEGARFLLGHTRLSIIDVEGGEQPIQSADDRFLLAANGEIYNHRELRGNRLSRHPYTTESDCEVITAAYEAFGEQGIALLNGMFAFVLIDQHASSVLCAVDPVGIKPLYYCQLDDVVLVASELKAIVVGLHAIKQPVALCMDSADNYLRNGWVDLSCSIVKGVRRLAPGESLTISESSPPQINQYQRVGSAKSENADCEPVDLSHLRDALRSALSRQMMADVPLGFFLSGGIDSSLLVALARDTGADVQTFTVDFVGSSEAESVSEADHARSVARHLGCRHHELEFDSAMLMSRLDDVFSFLDEPLADPAVIPLSVISEFAREHVKVCISGDGGDELFSGYLRHRLHPLRRKLTSSRSMASLARSFGAGLHRTHGVFGRPDLLRQGALAIDMLTSESFVYGPFCGRNARWLQSEQQNESGHKHVRATDRFGSLFELEMAGPLPGQMLTKMDRSSMSKSLEVRVPFLDLEFLRSALRFPSELNRRGSVGKLPLRSMLSEFVPSSISARPKHGFRVPLSGWISGDLRDEVRGRLLDRCCIPESLITKSSIEQLLNEHDARDAEHSIRIWALLSLNESIARLRIT